MKWWNIWREWLTHEQPSPVRSVVMPRLEVQLQTYNAQLTTGLLRSGTVSDVPHFLALEQDGYKGYIAWNERDFVKDLRHNPYAVYIVLELDQQVVAMISGRFTYKTAHISHLIVASAYQRQGIGQRLLRVWLQLAQSQGILQASLEVRSSNIVAQRLYQHHGFQVTQQVPHYYADGESALGMRLILTDNERVRK